MIISLTPANDCECDAPVASTTVRSDRGARRRRHTCTDCGLSRAATLQLIDAFHNKEN